MFEREHVATSKDQSKIHTLLTIEFNLVRENHPIECKKRWTTNDIPFTVFLHRPQQNIHCSTYCHIRGPCTAIVRLIIEFKDCPPLWQLPEHADDARHPH